MDVLGCIYLHLGEWAETGLGDRGTLRECVPRDDYRHATITIARNGGGILTIVIKDDHALLHAEPGGQCTFEYDDPDFPLNLQAAVLSEPTIDEVLAR